MPNDQKGMSNEKQEKRKPLEIQESETFGFSESVGTQISQISEYLKKSLRFILLLICLNVFSTAMNSWPLIDCWPREGLSSFLISMVINVIGFFIGINALMKIKEIRVT